MSGLKSSGKGNLECLLAWRAMSRSGDKVNRLFQKRVSALAGVNYPGRRVASNQRMGFWHTVRPEVH
jgi:hypothetical protein